MSSITQAIKLVYHDRRLLLLAFLVGGILAVTYLFLGGLVVRIGDSFFFDFNLIRLSTFLTLSCLAGLVAPLEVFALRKAAFSAKATGAAGAGLVSGLATLSCCAPLIFPALLSFLGFSGIFILQFNALIYQYLLPLSVVSIGLLLLSLKLVAVSIVAACKIR